MLAPVRRLPQEPGVYRFRDEGGRVLYVGRATQLRARVGSYWSHLGDRPHLRRMVARIARVEALVCASVHEAAWLERNLLEARMPRWNRTPGGQEVPVYLVLDAGPARPGLRLVHEPAPGLVFGPYLGGSKARLAVAALHRVFPLPYARSGLTGAERDMARRLGVTAGDRADLAGGIQAVLARETCADERLIALRDEAAAQTRYESAGRIQAELEGLQWVTGEQRATTHGGGDLDFAASAPGVRLRFEVRDGRLCGWDVRRTENAREADPPPGWTAFAQRNAALAAELF
jgi:excinuclease ABC subunit C